MPDSPAPHNDDAPPAAFRHSDAGIEASTDHFDPKGDSISARAVTINKPVADVFAYFRDFANLPHFMENVQSIDVLDTKRSHWIVKAPAGRKVEWDARITEEALNQHIAWASEPGADVPNAGRVEFRDAGKRGTIVTATITYDPPGGRLGEFLAKLFQREPAIQARRDLRRFKQLMETGEVATSAWTHEQYEKERG